MGGFVHALHHTQTFVEVAKLERCMTYALAFFFVIYLIYLFWLDKPVHLKDSRLLWEETKRLGGRGARCRAYRDGRVEAVQFIVGKGGGVITPERFHLNDLQATHGGEWKRKIFDYFGNLEDEVDLMPTLNLPPPPPQPEGPARIPRRDYGC